MPGDPGTECSRRWEFVSEIGGIRGMKKWERFLEAALLILWVAGMFCYGRQDSSEWK